MSLLEPLHDQLRHALGVVHRRAAGRQLGTAAQAGPEAGLLGFLRRAEEAAVDLLRRLRRADRPAVDAGGGHADEEHAVEAGVARGQRGVRASGVVRHALTICWWRRRDLAIFGHGSGPPLRCPKLASDGAGADCIVDAMTKTQKRYVYKVTDSPVGRLTLVASDDGLAGILWPNERPGRVRLPQATEDSTASGAGRDRTPAEGVLRRAAAGVRA